ncbi:MAG TPA: phenylalanine--tRNA ligase subunit beta [Candidatus Paceibacterota bacterium]
MKVSRNWLQRFFNEELPSAAALAEALTFHAFEIESVEALSKGSPRAVRGESSDNGNDWILDVKVTPNRGHDCLSHHGIAKEFSAILQLPMKSDPLREEVSLKPRYSDISLHIENANLCPRFVAAYIASIKVGPSPEWLRKHLESIGQKSVNNVVDATNFVMFDLGQPLHAFDAGKLHKKDNVYSLIIRPAKRGETVTGLDDKTYALNETMLAIVDGVASIVASIAGIKGGKPTGIDETTTDIILEGANWNGANIRKTSQALKLRTDASSRFEQVISPELAPYGVRACADLICEIAGGEVVGFVDEYPNKQQQTSISVDAGRINAILGSKLSDAEVGGALTRLDLPFTKSGDAFVIEPPFERLDLTVPEDIAEEVGRITGYDKIPPVELPPMSTKPEVNPNFYAAERAREEYVAKGYSEVYTSIFADDGERVIANKVDGVRPYLRTNLDIGLGIALERNVRNKDLLGLKQVKLFEIGTVWKDNKETIVFNSYCETPTNKDSVVSGERSGDKPLTDYISEILKQYDELPLSETKRYVPFSKYPFIVRDIALWVSAGTKEDDVLEIIRTHAGELLVLSELFDTFKKGERTSLAFRLVFQSFDRTLTDFDANERMASISSALKAKGFEIR